MALNCALSAVIFLVILVSHATCTAGSMIPLGEESSASTVWRRMMVNVALTALLVWEGPFLIDVLFLSFGLLSVLIMAEIEAGNPELDSLGAAANVEWVNSLVNALLWLVPVSLQVARWYVRTWVERTLVLLDVEKHTAR
jgi:hypothetical protein